MSIPNYQRPYKWTVHNVRQLFTDIAVHKNVSAYRLGTIVFHQEDGRRNIVDGQQRTLTLLLTARALLQNRRATLVRKDLREQLDALQGAMINPKFTNAVSRANLLTNAREIRRTVSRSDFTEEVIDFLLNRCEVVTFTLNDISEAFQFFDSQNARGRDLEPHDLLKAYHLREFSQAERHLQAQTVHRWERAPINRLAELFATYLSRIRRWMNGASARYFTKADTHLFKGMNIDAIDRYPYVESVRITHHFVDHYNGQFERRIDGQRMPYPFRLDQIILNGRRFFEMIGHYQEAVSDLSNILALRLDGYAPEILKVLNSYSGRRRTGDRYVRSLFDCLLLCYIDKFGHAELSRAIEKGFIWAWTLRLRMRAVRVATLDNYVVSECNLFMRLKEAILPAHLLAITLPTLSDSRATRVEPIQDLFRRMHYLA